MRLTYSPFYNPKYCLYSKPIKGLQFCGKGYSFAFNGMERDDETYGAGNAYDFGARIYDSRLGKWFSSDAFKDVYVSLSPFNFAADNPINIVDRAGHLLKDKDGNIIATSNGKIVSRQSSTYVENGKTYKTINNYEEVTIYTDKGTPINALKKIESYVEEKGQDGKFTRVQKEPKPGSESNCHGYTFGGGALVIEDITDNGEVINTILKDDGYDLKGADENNADGFVDRFKKSKGVLHSGVKNNNGTWSADQGDAEPTENVPLKDARGASGDPSNAGVVEIQYFKKGASDNDNINGVNVVNPQNARNAGAKTDLKPVGTKK